MDIIKLVNAQRIRRINYVSNNKKRKSETTQKQIRKRTRLGYKARRQIENRRKTRGRKRFSVTKNKSVKNKNRMRKYREVSSKGNFEVN